MCVILLASFGFTICKKEKKKKRFRYNSLSSKKLKYLGTDKNSNLENKYQSSISSSLELKRFFLPRTGTIVRNNNDKGFVISEIRHFKTIDCGRSTWIAREDIEYDTLSGK